MREQLSSFSYSNLNKSFVFSWIIIWCDTSLVLKSISLVQIRVKIFMMLMKKRNSWEFHLQFTSNNHHAVHSHSAIIYNLAMSLSIKVHKLNIFHRLMGSFISLLPFLSRARFHSWRNSYKVFIFSLSLLKFVFQLWIEKKLQWVRWAH